MFDWIIDWVLSLWSSLTAWVNSLINSVYDYISSVWSNITAWVSSLLGNITAWVNSLIADLDSWWRTQLVLLNETFGWVLDFRDAIVEFFTDPLEFIWTRFTDWFLGPEE